MALVAQNSDLFYEVLFGATKVRHVLVAVNWRLAPAEVAYIVNAAMAGVLFVGEASLPLVAEILLELHSVRRVIALGGDLEGESYIAWCDRHDASDPRLASSGDDVVLQLYTSGTTGRLKGVQITRHDGRVAGRERVAPLCGTGCEPGRMP